MRILIAADLHGGVRTFVRELTAQLAAADVEVHLALLGPRQCWSEDVGATTCQVRDLRLEWMEEPWSDVRATAAWVQELTERHQPDVIHMNTFAPVLSPHVPVLLTVHSCVLSWWRAVHGESAPPGWNRYRQLVIEALSRADIVTTPTRALLNDVSVVYGPLPQARVIPNGRHVPAADQAAPPRERLVVSVGRVWDPAKNAALLGRASEMIDGRVALIGAGEVPGLTSLGVLDEQQVLAWLRRAAVFAEPARYEPFGLAALEAALCGCALVLGDIPSLREVWGDAATFVPIDDPVALADAINRLLGDAPLRSRMAARARSAASRFSPQAMATAYLDGYRQLAQTAAAA